MNNQNDSSNTQPNKANKQDDIHLFTTDSEHISTSSTEPNEFKIFTKETEPNIFHSDTKPSETINQKATGSITKPNDFQRNQPFYLRKRPVKKKRSKRKMVAIILSSLCGLIFVYLLVIGLQFYFAISSGFTELSPSKLRSKAVNKEQDAFSILLLGTDERNNEPDWHPDSLMVAIINPKAGSIQIISLPRDLKVKMSTGEITKINQTATIANKYGIDPYKVTRETVENFLNIPIDYFIRVNFHSLVGIVDAVDGVTVNVERPFSAKMIGYSPATFKKGLNHLNGSEALTYARERKQDPLGDIGRSTRQGQIVVALTKELTKPSMIFSLPEIASALNGNVKHNFKLSDFYTLAKLFQESKPKFQLQVFDSKSAEIGDDWFELWTSEKRITVSATLQKQLEYKPIKPLEPSPLLEKEEQFASIDDDEDYPDFLAKLEEEKSKKKDDKKEKKKEKKEDRKKDNKKEKEQTELAEKKKEKKKVVKNRENEKGKLANNNEKKESEEREKKSKFTITTNKSLQERD